MKKYILAIDALVNGFTINDTIGTVTFKYSASGSRDICSALQPGDLAFIYYKNDRNLICSEIVVKEKNGDSIVFAKDFEFSNGVKIPDDELEKTVASCDAVEITEEQYTAIKSLLLKTNFPEFKNESTEKNGEPFPDQPGEKETIEDLETERVKGGENVILYGVPGAGKSHTIKKDYCKEEACVERLVFHPDYTYSDFVGQILPHVADDGTVSYDFTPGPFTKLLCKAYNTPGSSFYLVIEEINRGNAPAIFGDIFQLLDRDGDGNSIYSITNSDIARIVYKDENHKVSIPSNMSILCTMNTSDQNVFTLDTAFQRRWNMRLIKNKFEAGEEDFASTKILDTDVTWEHFFNSINRIILEKNIRMTSSEDKRLGTHFVTKEVLDYKEGDEKHNRRFPEKVIKYLWDDAFKFTKEDVFDFDKVKSLEDVIETFISNEKNERFKVFKENIYEDIVSSKE